MTNVAQYLIIRSDFKNALNWLLGAVKAQCCHDATAIMHLHAGDDATKLCIFGGLGNMHEVVLEVKDEAALVKLAKKLQRVKGFTGYVKNSLRIFPLA